MRRGNRYAIVFLTCLMAMPTCVKLLPGFHAESVTAAFAAGALLGCAHLLARPVIRILTAPIGCLTLGLIQPAIDIALIYACDRLTDGFTAGSIFELMLAVMMINIITFIAAGRH